jgi:hypothetical protein
LARIAHFGCYHADGKRRVVADLPMISGEWR